MDHMVDAPKNIACLVPDLPSSAMVAPYLERVDTARWYTNFGPLVRELEDRLEGLLASVGAPSETRVVTCSTGTSAIDAGLAALQLPPGSRVLVPALTFPASALAIIGAGHVPVFSDVCPRRWQLTPKIARRVIAEQRIDLVMPVTTYGRATAVDEWDQLTIDTGVPVLIDAAPAFGEQSIGRTTSVAFSFHATKPFGIGEGGAFVSADPELAARARIYTNFGFVDGVVERFGTNAKLSEYHAAVGLAQLERWPALLRRRQRVWTAYRRHLRGMDGVQLQSWPTARAPALLIVRLVADAATVAARLADVGVHTRRWYVPTLVDHPAFAPYVPADPKLPVTEHLAPHLLGLPFHTALDDDDIAYVCDALERAVTIEEPPRFVAASTELATALHTKRVAS